MREAPTGTVSFLFTDIIGSTRLWEKFPAQMGTVLARHDALIRSAVEAHAGLVFKTVGDSVCAAFQSPRDSLEAAIDAQRALAAEDWKEIGTLTVRMAIHAGPAEFRDGDYFGGTLNRVSRIEGAAHGGQILLSRIAVELLEDEPLDGITFKSLGNHRLRNLDRPEHLYQVVVPGLRESFPPPRSMEALPNNLPVQTTSFVGREKQLEEVKRLLESERLLTLMGTGGTGKTRLALKTGAQVIHEFRDGVWLVELALIAEPERVVEAVAAAVGAREEPDRPLRSTLVNYLRGKSTLVLLDNCEHLVSAASSLASELLRFCPRLKILATSRHSLGIGGEAIFRVPPLQILDVRIDDFRGDDLVTRLSQYEAVKLFVARAVAVRPDFSIRSLSSLPPRVSNCSTLTKSLRGWMIVSVCCAANAGTACRTSRPSKRSSIGVTIFSQKRNALLFAGWGSLPADARSRPSKRCAPEMASKSSRCSTCSNSSLTSPSSRWSPTARILRAIP
jgi:class 3 adenylate cyclase